MSFRVLVIPEDPTYNGYILQPIVERMLGELGKPNAIIAHTCKGHGVSFIENSIDWHHRVPTDAELAAAIDELDAVCSGGKA